MVRRGPRYPHGRTGPLGQRLGQLAVGQHPRLVLPDVERAPQPRQVGPPAQPLGDGTADRPAQRIRQVPGSRRPPEGPGLAGDPRNQLRELQRRVERAQPAQALPGHHQPVRFGRHPAVAHQRQQFVPDRLPQRRAAEKLGLPVLGRQEHQGDRGQVARVEGRVEGGRGRVQIQPVVPVEQQHHRTAPAHRVDPHGTPPAEPLAAPADPGPGEGRHIVRAEGGPVRLGRGVRRRGDGTVGPRADRIERIGMGLVRHEDAVGHPQPRGQDHLRVPAVGVLPAPQRHGWRPALEVEQGVGAAPQEEGPPAVAGGHRCGRARRRPERVGAGSARQTEGGEGALGVHRRHQRLLVRREERRGRPRRAPPVVRRA